jgi:hypothetical protein
MNSCHITSRLNKGKEGMTKESAQRSSPVNWGWVASSRTKGRNICKDTKKMTDNDIVMTHWEATAQRSHWWAATQANRCSDSLQSSFFPLFSREWFQDFPLQVLKSFGTINKRV